jgi:hypothetical protein
VENIKTLGHGKLFAKPSMVMFNVNMFWPVSSTALLIFCHLHNLNIFNVFAPLTLSFSANMLYIERNCHIYIYIV